MSAEPRPSVALRRALLVVVVAALVAASVALGWIAAHWGLEP
jgi:hypothetical protein